MNNTILELLQLLPEEEIEKIPPDRLDTNYHYDYRCEHSYDWGIIRIKIDLDPLPTHWFDFLVRSDIDEIFTDVYLDMDHDGAKSVISVLDKLSADRLKAYNLLWQLRLCGKMLGQPSN